MTTLKTNGNAPETLSDIEILDTESIVRRLDHLDEQLHRITRFIDMWEPRLERYANPGAAIRAYLPGGKHGRPSGQ